MDASRTSSISHAETDEDIGDFWDTHDFMDYDTDAPDVPIEIGSTVPIEPHLFRALAEQAQQLGIQVETLVNLWLQEKLAEESDRASA